MNDILFSIFNNSWITSLNITKPPWLHPLLIKGFPSLGRMQQGALWFGRSQHHKQKKQTTFYLER
jgi:hypothetical protein